MARQVVRGVILPNWLDFLGERSSYKEVKFKKISPLVKTCYPLIEDVTGNETPGWVLIPIIGGRSYKAAHNTSYFTFCMHQF